MTNNEFINIVGAIAREDMKKSHILASLTIAQAILESNWGNSSLSKAPNNNLFGIKGEYNGQYVTLPTKEFENGKWVTIEAKFRKYSSWTESVADHSSLFNRLDRYSNLRGCTDYKLACKYVREDGYATDPGYTNKLINLIEKYDLTRFDDGSSDTNNADSIISNIQSWLNDTYDTGLKVDGVYGSLTHKALVKGLQIELNKQFNAGLNPDGIFGAKTRAACITVKEGAKGNITRLIQSMLYCKGYNIVIDGIFGNDTVAAIKQFQSNNNLVVDGIVGKNTFEGLFK